MLSQLAVLVALLPAISPATAAPAHVTEAWSTDRASVKVTWTESSDLADHISLIDAVGATRKEWDVAAGRANTLTVANGDFPTNQDLHFEVKPAGSDTPLRSAVFDTDLPPTPVATGAVPRMDGTILLTWTSTASDDNPGDPLDLPRTDRFTPVAGHPEVNDWDDLVTTPITAKSFVVPASRTAPIWLAVVGSSNEWGAPESGSRIVRIARTRLTMPVLMTRPTGDTLQVAGFSTLVSRACDARPCFTLEHPDQDRVVELQTRTSKAAAWKTVATTKAAAKDGTFSFTITSPGTREYRVLLRAVGWKVGYDGKTPAASGPVVSRSSGFGTTGGGGLPITGAPVAWVAGAGALLVLAGGALAVATRRRRKAPSGS